MTRIPLRLLLVAAVLAATVTGPFAQPAPASVVWVGGCQITLTASSSALGLMPTHPASIGLAGSGPCATNVGLEVLTITGLTLTTNSATGGFGCLAGIAVGTGTVKLSDPSFPYVQVDFTAVNTGGVVTMVGVAGAIVFDGIGDFAIDPVALAACASGTPMTGATWTGALAFQDPVIG